MRFLPLRAGLISTRLAPSIRTYTAFHGGTRAAALLKFDEHGVEQNWPLFARDHASNDKKGQYGTSEHHLDLIKSPELRRDPSIWNKLYRAAKKQNRTDGVKGVWKALEALPIDEVPVLYDLEIWEDLSGGELIDYMKKLHQAGIKPPKGSLRKIGFEHHNLEFISATKEELIEAALLNYEVKLPNRIYDTIMPRLCANGSVDHALAWHRKLVSNGDPPRKVQDVEELRQMLIDKRLWAAALEVKRSIVAENTSVVASSVPLAQTADDQQEALQSFVSKLDERVGVATFAPSMEDHTCARFFATTFFSVEFVMEGMALYGVTSFGPLAIREIVKRTIRGRHCDTSLARQYFAKMDKLRLGFDIRYGRLLKYLAEENKEVLLYNVVASDFHPDSFDDLQFQESLLQSSDLTIIERTRAVLCFEMNEQEAEIRNILLRANLESLEVMIADAVPIAFESRAVLLDSMYIDRHPWIVETKLRALTRAFLRLPHVTIPEWRRILMSFLCIVRPHLRRDFEALLLSIRYPELFDHRMTTDIIRWYLRLGCLGRRPSIETMLSGVRVLAAIRDQGITINIEGPCEANLMSLFGNIPISEIVDLKKRSVAQRLGIAEDFITAIREIWGTGLWPGMSPAEAKEAIFAKATKLQLLREQERGHSELSPTHSSAYNPGKVKYVRDQARLGMIQQLEERRLKRIEKHEKACLELAGKQLKP